MSFRISNFLPRGGFGLVFHVELLGYNGGLRRMEGKRYPERGVPAVNQSRYSSIRRRIHTGFKIKCRIKKHIILHLLF